MMMGWLRKPANSLQLRPVSVGIFQLHKMTCAGPWNTLYSWLTDVLLYLGWIPVPLPSLQLLREFAADRDTWRNAWDMSMSIPTLGAVLSKVSVLMLRGSSWYWIGLKGLANCDATTGISSFHILRC